MLPYLPPEQHAQLTAHKRHGLDCTDYRAKSRSYRYEPNIENARVLLAPTLDELVAVCLIAPNLENVLQLLAEAARYIKTLRDSGQLTSLPVGT
jgi:hypothetical protein